VPKRTDPREPTEPETKAATKSDQDPSRDALDFCFDDVSSLRMLGAAPLSDLTSAPEPTPPAPASASAPASARGGSQRWNLVVLALVVLTLAATAGALLLGR
jgi:hypothetical protein